MHLSSKIANKERKNASNIQDNASSCTSYHTCNILKKILFTPSPFGHLYLLYMFLMLSVSWILILFIRSITTGFCIRNK